MKKGSRFFFELLKIQNIVLLRREEGDRLRWRSKNNSHPCHPDRAKRRKGLKQVLDKGFFAPAQNDTDAVLPTPQSLRDSLPSANLGSTH